MHKAHTPLVVRIQGGLGNQMFQYAYAYATAHRNHSDFLLDTSPFKRYHVRKNGLSQFEYLPPYAPQQSIPFYERIGGKYRNWLLFRIIRGIGWRLNPRDQRETTKGFDPQLAQLKKGYVVGYFQSDKYFSFCKEEIRKLFSFKKMTQEKVQNFCTTKELSLNNYVAISVRRGDFATDPQHYLIPLEFYLTAKQQHFPTKKMLIFSDDISRCKQHFPHEEGICFVEELGALEQLCLLSQCRSFILSNSTFSRWGAYLAPDSEKKVVRPHLAFDEKVKGEAYMRDHYPEEWIPHRG